MWVATTIAVLGFFTVAIVTQLFGYRLGGTITVPILAVYTLKSFVTLAVFVFSAMVAYLGLYILKQRTLIYGRDELLAAILIGTLVPVVMLIGFAESVGFETRTVAFIGSILPGLAAYNAHQLKPEYRRTDLLATAGLLVVLLALGWSLITPANAGAYGTITPPVLFSSTADIAVLKSAVAVTPPEPPVVPRVIAIGVLTVGLLIAEVLRSRFDVRVGVITAALLAIFALANVWFLVLYGIVYVVAFGVMEGLNWITLRYGRVLLGIGTAFALLITVPVTLLMPIDRGLTAFFTAILAGVSAYNAHATAPRENRLVLPLQIAVFVPTLLTVRVFALPTSRGIPQALTPPIWIASVLIVGVGLLYTWHVTVRQPSNEAVLSGSILSEGDGT